METFSEGSLALARRYGRKQKGLLEMALAGRWPVAASLSLMIFFFGGVMLPFLFGKSIYLEQIPPLLLPYILALGLFFAAIALIKFLLEKRRLSRARAGGVTRRDPAQDDALSDSEAFSKDDASRVPATPQAWSIEVLRDMEWKRFEEICLAFYRAKGIRAECTPLGPDGGVDVRLYQSAEDPGRCTAIVQCKAWGERYVGVKPVRELRGVMAHEKIEKAFFMAPGAYSDEARAFAQENRITLIDGTMFLAMLRRLPEAVSRELLAQATAGDWTTPTCPHCGVKMVERNGKSGKFWGCRNYPKCRQILGMRG